MDSVIVDTDVLSYLFKGDSRGESYRPHLDGKLGVLSFMTIAELDFWASTRNWGSTRRAELTAFLEPYTVIHSDLRLCEMWAEVRSQVMRDGHHIDTADCWIAATARLYDIPLLTHNRSHFAHVSDLKTLSAEQ
jgi:tRNA(fMet)-specific endonuclease VapC